jgi:hypothetical protein
MKAHTKNKIVAEEDKREFVMLILTHFDSAFRMLQFVGRTTAVAGSVDGILLRELAQYAAAKLLEAGQLPEEAEETLLSALEDEVDARKEEEEEDKKEDEEEHFLAHDLRLRPIITNPVAEKDVMLKGGLPGSRIDSRDGAAGGEDISND